MKITVKPWTWRHGHQRTRGAMVTTHFPGGRTIVAFIPTAALVDVADQLVDIAETQEDQ